MRSNRACNQDWHLTPVYVSFEVEKDDICGGYKENELWFRIKTKNARNRR